MWIILHLLHPYPMIIEIHTANFECIITRGAQHLDFDVNLMTIDGIRPIELGKQGIAQVFLKYPVLFGHIRVGLFRVLDVQRHSTAGQKTEYHEHVAAVFFTRGRSHIGLPNRTCEALCIPSRRSFVGIRNGIGSFGQRGGFVITAPAKHGYQDHKGQKDDCKNGDSFLQEGQLFTDLLRP